MRKYHLKKLKKEPLYDYEPWKITEKEFSIENNHQNESIFSLGNGYIGLRGTLEENYSGPDDTSTPGFYINGVYASECIIYGEEAPKQPRCSQTITNLADWSIINLYIDGEKFDMLTGKVENYSRCLDMKQGVLYRELIWESPGGKRVKIKICRFLSAQRLHLGVIKYDVEVLNFSGQVKIVSSLEGDVGNKYHLRNPRALSMLGRGFVEDSKEMYLEQFIGSTNIKISTVVKNDLQVQKDGKIIKDVDKYRDISIIEGERLIQEFSAELGTGEGISLTKYMSIYDYCETDNTGEQNDIDHKKMNGQSNNLQSRKDTIGMGDPSAHKGHHQKCTSEFNEKLCEPEEHFKNEEITSSRDNLKDLALLTVRDAYEEGFQNILNEHIEYFETYWEDMDVKIEGDISLQQAFRYNALQLFHSSGRDGKTNVAAKGLTGEFYEGHYFWDTEIYVIPFFLYSKPEIARSLLIYRYNILDKARENAERVRLDGALFPWRTINGEEASAFFMGSTVQFHINADIAYAIKQYVNATNDEDFMYNYGVEILIETARMWASRGCYVPLVDNKYCYNEVCGPDEYKPGVSNNCYTNYMAKFNLEYASEMTKKMKKIRPDKYQDLADRLEFNEEEMDKWDQLAEDMFLPYDEKVGIHPQDDSFLLKDEIDIDSLDDSEFPLVANWHPLTIWRYQVIKQADVILLMFLLGDKFTIDEKKANYDYYEPKTTHDSSLSPSIYSIIAAEIGYYQDAYDYFIQTARLDLDDFNENTWKGLHLAALASSWLSLVHGFAGMRDYKQVLSFSPYLPDKWDSYQLKLKYKGCQFKIHVGKNRVVYSLLSGDSLDFLHKEKDVLLTKETPEKSFSL
ncbi:MAG: glycoside hydrolase family 65 protein [Halanaerobiales bacterium]